MSSSLKSSWRVSRQTVFGASRSVFILSLLLVSGFWILASFPAQAIIDTNQNGASDPWERHHNNGNLFTAFDPTADLDGDGWTNEQEAITGTNPSDGRLPAGFLRPIIERISAVYLSPEVEGGEPTLVSPETVSIRWNAITGKKYTVFASTDLTSGSWIPIGQPQTSHPYLSPSIYIPLTQPDGSIPEKLFFHVSAEDTDTDSDTLTDYEENQLGSSSYSADGDYDGLSDPDEFFIYQTNFNLADSDNDGVTDGDEILFNFTNPLSATDADEDGIPDDFEKHFAKLLLAYQSEETYWEAYHAGLLAGNLDATHDYTGDGINARELAKALKKITAAAPTDSGYTVESETRRNSLQSAYYYPPGSYSSSQGTYYHSVPDNFDEAESMIPTANLNSAYLLSRIDGVAWQHSSMSVGDQIYVDSVSTESAFRRTPVFLMNGTKFQGRMSQQRCRIIASNPGHKGSIRNYLKLINESNYFTWNNRGVISAEPFKVQFPKGRMVSDWYEFKSPFVDETGGRAAGMSLVPMEVAPEVLAVNSDFDEGRIDPATGYAIPDCDDMPGVDQKTGSGNTQTALNASRAHLDGLFANDEKVTEDMHKGWFGVNPNRLNDDFWAGANVTIRKIDKIDDETGYKESGQVRFYAKWSSGHYGISPYDFQTLQPVNLVSAGVNGNSSNVYGASSTIPDGAEFYMEGVRPGKITLEWRLQKGTIDVKHEQTFKVETRKSVAEWQEEVRYQIRLQTKVKSGTEVDIALYHSGNGFRNTSGNQAPGTDNVLRVQAIYYYYQQLFKQMPDKFMWAGMAKTAAAPIYAGMSDLTTWAQVQDAVPLQAYGTATHIMVRGLLLGGQKKIFEDMGWAHRAYMASGRWALDWVDQNTIQKPTDFAAWRDFYAGIEDTNQTKINDANRDLLLREQRDVVQSSYTSFATNGWFLQPRTGYNWLNNIAAWLLNFQVVAEDPGLGANVGEWLSANALRNPMPGGPAFRTTVPNGRIDIFNDRWAWTNNSTNGMLQIWMGFSANQRLSENNKTMYSGAAAYSFDTGGLPIE